MANISQWIYNYITTSTSITQNTTKVYPSFIPSTETPPFVVYQNNIGYSKEWVVEKTVISIKAFEADYDSMESLTDNLLHLFDNSTAVIRQTFNGVQVHSVQIINKVTGLYDKENDLYFGVLDIQVNYST
jgi:hypothetical protein